MDNQRKVKMVARKISFLMHHQEILPDLKEIAAELYEGESDSEIDRNSPEYLLGAFEALVSLISALEEKGPQIKE